MKTKAYKNPEPGPHEEFKKFLREASYVVIISIVGIYGLVSGILLMEGMRDAGDTWHAPNKCIEPKQRVIQLFPTYELGCYLGQIPEE